MGPTPHAHGRRSAVCPWAPVTQTRPGSAVLRIHAVIKGRGTNTAEAGYWLSYDRSCRQALLSWETSGFFWVQNVCRPHLCLPLLSSNPVHSVSAPFLHVFLMACPLPSCLAAGSWPKISVSTLAMGISIGAASMGLTGTWVSLPNRRHASPGESCVLLAVLTPKGLGETF